MTRTRFVTAATAIVLTSGIATAAITTSKHAPTTPAAFFIAEFDIHDRPAMQPYRENVEATFKPFGGRFVARGGAVVSLEGTPVKGGVVIIRFDSMTKAKAWYHSPAYAPLQAIRHRAATTRAFIVAEAG